MRKQIAASLCLALCNATAGPGPAEPGQVVITGEWPDDTRIELRFAGPAT